MPRAGLLLVALIAACRSGGGGGDGAVSEDEQPDEHATMAAEHAMGGRGGRAPAAEDLHLRLTTVRAPAPGDSARAAEILVVMRRDLVRYRDIEAAKADGFRQFIPSGGAAAIQHYTKVRWAFQARNALDPARPTSLLYQRAADGSLELAGAMFTAPAPLTEDDLNTRLPLSIARWHQHINWCLPPLADARRRWRETRNGQPVFGPQSPIATAEACEAVGGRFRPRLFGWMIHVMAFSDGDPWATHKDAHGAHSH